MPRRLVRLVLGRWRRLADKPQESEQPAEPPSIAGGPVHHRAHVELAHAALGVEDDTHRLWWRLDPAVVGVRTEEGLSERAWLGLG